MGEGLQCADSCPRTGPVELAPSLHSPHRGPESRDWRRMAHRFRRTPHDGATPATAFPSAAHWVMRRRSIQRWPRFPHGCPPHRIQGQGHAHPCVHAARAKEPKTNYVWEDLSVERYEDGAVPTFGKRQPKGAMHEYAIAGTLHLQHLARLGHRLDENASQLDLDVFRLAEALGSSDDMAQEQIRTRLFRMLKAHEQEWNAFLDSLGPSSFVARWATRFR